MSDLTAARPTTRALVVRLRVVALVACGYLAGSVVSFVVLGAPTSLAVFFPPAGVTVAALLLTDRSCWPWVLGTAVVVEIASDLFHHLSLASAAGFALANCLEPLTAAVLLGAVGFGGDLSRRRDFGWFLGLAVAVGPMVGALVGATAIALDDGPWLPSFAAFWSGDALGVLAVGGTILAMWRRGWRAPDVARLVAWAAVVAAVTAVAFLPQDLPLIYLPVPLMVAVAMRGDVAYVASGGFAVTLTANVVSSLGYGPWGAPGEVETAQVATLQLFLATTVLSAWLLAIEIGERERASRRYEREHETALQLQRALLPHVPHRLPGLAIAASYRPADLEQEVGGDWYDVFPLPDGKIAIAVGDIVGHDLDAAVAMGRLHAVLRVDTAGGAAGPVAVLAALDEATESIPEAWCSTVGYAEFDPTERTLCYACAGHLPPLLVTRNGARFLSGGRSTPLGVTNTVRGQASEAIPPGAVLIWYSDGLVERRTRTIDEGLQLLAASAARIPLGAPPGEWRDRILAELTETRMEDDVVVVCLCFDGDVGSVVGDPDDASVGGQASGRRGVTLPHQAAARARHPDDGRTATGSV